MNNNDYCSHLFVPQKNPAFSASHYQKPYTFPAFLAFFSENTLFSSFSSPAGHPECITNTLAEGPTEMILPVWYD